MIGSIYTNIKHSFQYGVSEEIREERNKRDVKIKEENKSLPIRVDIITTNDYDQINDYEILEDCYNRKYISYSLKLPKLSITERSKYLKDFLSNLSVAYFNDKESVDKLLKYLESFSSISK